MANTLTLFAFRKSIIHCLTTDTEVLKINNQQADAILGSRASYAHGLSHEKSLGRPPVGHRSHEFDNKQTKKLI